MPRPMNSAASQSDISTTANSQLAYRLACEAGKGGLLVYICPDLRSYRSISEELAFFLQEKPELLWRFPA